MGPESTALTTDVGSESPYQLDKVQTLRASSALLKHIKTEVQKKETVSGTKNLLAPENSSEDVFPSDVEPIWLVLTTKKFMTDQKRLKPRKVLLPHSLHTSSNTSICLISPEPQRQFKDAIAHPSFPTTLSKRITKVISIKKLEAKYRSFESRRQLRDSYDLFLADDRIVTYLAKFLGKTFYNTTAKRPIPVSLEASKPKERKNAALPSTKVRKEPSDTKSIAAPPLLAKEIERSLSTAQINLSPSTTTAVRVGLASFTPEQLAANIEAVMASLAGKLVGWKNVRAVHVKGPNTMALPIWLAEELWVDEGYLLEDEEAAEAKAKAAQKGKRKRKLIEGKEAGHADWAGKRKVDGESETADEPKQKKVKKLNDEDLSQEMKERREKLRQQKREARDSIEGNDVTMDRTLVAKPKVKKTRRATTAISAFES
ncbi:hypothetical protein HO173_002686 [Letharia columbiana]|uniref:Ribosomal protein L1 n=1 Tax=Letharia columbiana TaxID=112416 RepID=A0A8H6L896_9LECA|nr:uncharacterized protein HO173_002686 [Letharia columbiana]KAF6239424.1 hypothetical protein HO173_002686 [Letharia columbiana]